MSFKIRTKLFASFGIVLCLTAVIGYIGWANTVTFSSEFSHLYANNLRGAIALAKIAAARTVKVRCINLLRIGGTPDRADRGGVIGANRVPRIGS